jgi:hypothetical protein
LRVGFAVTRGATGTTARHVHACKFVNVRGVAARKVKSVMTGVNPRVKEIELVCGVGFRNTGMRITRTPPTVVCAIW